MHRPGHYSEGGYANHTPYRSTSREQMNQQGYPAAARQAGRPAHQSSISAPSNGPPTTRNRSISSPSINEAQRRAMDNNRPPMPDGPLPGHIHRSQSNSPHLMSGGIDERVNNVTPAMRFNSPALGGYGTPRNGTPIQYQREMMASPALPPQTPSMDMPPPSQLKVKVHAQTAGQVLTLVVPSNISYQTLKDRIDAKLIRSTNISLTDRGGGSNTVKLKYLDEDDYINIASDEDVQIAFETWREQRGEGLNGMGEIELFCL